MKAVLPPAAGSDDLMRRFWDVIVVGAGPAGAMAAREAANAGASTLLLDRSPFPRDKVCGGCINAAALELLDRAGFGRFPQEAGGEALHRLRIRAAGSSVDLPVSRCVAMSRRALDAQLVDHAVAAGVTFRSGMSASVGAAQGKHRVVVVMRRGGSSRAFRAGVVVAAHGIGGRVLDRLAAFTSVVRTRSYIGMQGFISDDGGWMPHGAIMMHCGRGGYVGMARMENGQINVAAALDPHFVREHSDAGRAINRLLQESGTDAECAFDDAAWKGTTFLTRHRRRVAGERLLLAGDAIGYVEPFTGEGIAWALATGAAAGRMAARATTARWDVGVEDEWHRTCRAMLAGRHARCLAMTRLLRRPLLCRSALSVLSRSPRLAGAVTGWISGQIPGS